MFQSTYLKTRDIQWFQASGLNDAYPLPPTSLWVSLHSASPSLTGENEIAFATRTEANTFGAIANIGNLRQFPIDQALDFINSPVDGTATHIGIWDASAGGNFLIGGELLNVDGSSAPIALSIGNDVTIASGVIRISYQLGVFSEYYIDLKLNWFKGSLFPALPSVTNPIFIEVGTGLNSSGAGTPFQGIGREAVVWGDGVTVENYIRLSNSATTTLGTAPPLTSCNSAAFYDAESNGNLLLAAQFPTQTFLIETPLFFSAGQINIDV